MPAKHPMKRTTVMMPPQTNVALIKISKTTGYTVAELVRQAVQQFIDSKKVTQ